MDASREQRVKLPPISLPFAPSPPIDFTPISTAHAQVEDVAEQAKMANLFPFLPLPLSLPPLRSFIH